MHAVPLLRLLGYRCAKLPTLLGLKAGLILALTVNLSYDPDRWCIRRSRISPFGLP